MIVATVLTVYGIETLRKTFLQNVHLLWLQQYLPFTVLKPMTSMSKGNFRFGFVATVLTVYGIETLTVCQVFRPYL